MISHSKPIVTDNSFTQAFDNLRKGYYFNNESIANFYSLIQQRRTDCSLALTPSGSFGIYFALKNLSLRKNSQVLLPSYVCKSVLWAVLENGLQPCFYDLAPDSWTTSPNQVENCINDSTSAIILAPVFGFTQNVQPFRKFKIPIILDLCQSFDQYYDAKFDDLGDFFVLSFHPTKMLPAGFGGLIGTNRNIHRAKVDDIKSSPFEFPQLNAEVGIQLLNDYPKIQQQRINIADYYFENIPEYLCKNLLSQKDTWTPFRFLLWDERNTNVNSIMNEFNRRGIHVRKGVDKLLTSPIGNQKIVLSNSIKAYNYTLSIPLHPYLSNDDLLAIISTVNNIYEQIAV